MIDKIIFEKCLEEIKKEIREKMDVAMIGLSGGADSTLVALLCVEALGKENVIGVHMPYSQHDADFFNSQSKKLAKYLGIQDIYHPITHEGDLHRKNIETNGAHLGIKLDNVNHGNNLARTRMKCLYSYGHGLETKLKKAVRVANTCNRSENFIGYATKFGDAARDFAPIADLYKDEVYEFLYYFVSIGKLIEEFINKVPSAGLWPDQTDEKEIGYSYDAMKPSIMKIVSRHWSEEDWNEIDEFVWNTHMKNEHKEQMPSIINLRKYLDVV